jgi:7,8-dihydroneopterin aldolase/epimerase/oxygenase
MFIINLNNLIFHSFHGVYNEESILGNTFEVNVSVAFEPNQPVTSLEQTINYATIYEIIKHRMSVATPLLETLAQELTQQIYDFDNRIKNISVSVEKKNTPITGIEGSVSVQYKKEY